MTNHIKQCFHSEAELKQCFLSEAERHLAMAERSAAAGAHRSHPDLEMNGQELTRFYMALQDAGFSVFSGAAGIRAAGFNPERVQSVIRKGVMNEIEANLYDLVRLTEEKDQRGMGIRMNVLRSLMGEAEGLGIVIDCESEEWNNYKRLLNGEVKMLAPSGDSTSIRPSVLPLASLRL